MKNQNGIMIRLLREKESISLEELSRGILSTADLSRIEAGEKEMRGSVHEALLQRMGKSIGKMDILLSDEEYAYIFFKTLILESILGTKWSLFKQLVDEYSKNIGDSPIDKQYILMMQAIGGYLKGIPKAECCIILQTALKETEISWPVENLKQYYLCTQEIQILLLHEYMKEDSQTSLLEEMKAYLELRYQDEEVKAGLYPQCLWRLVELYEQKGYYHKAYTIVNQAIKCLTENGVLTLLHDFLERKLLYILKRKKKEQEVSCIKKQIEALKLMYQMADYFPKTDSDKIFSYIQINKQMEVSISNELICTLRQVKNMSQEELSEEICTRETISRIERGKNSPNKKNLRKMLSRLGFENGNYLGIDTCHYEILEKVRKYRKAALENNVVKASKILDEIEQELEISTQVNNQFLRSARLTIRLLDKNPNYEEILYQLTEALTYTMKEYKGAVYRVPSRVEAEILMGMVICMKRLNRLVEACDLLESMRLQYENSKVMDIHHTVSAILLYINYSGVLELSNDLEESEKMGKRALQIATYCQRGDYPGLIIGNLSCVYKKRKQLGDEERCKTYLKCSYYLLLLFQSKKRAEILRKFYLHNYNQDID